MERRFRDRDCRLARTAYTKRSGMSDSPSETSLGPEDFDCPPGLTSHRCLGSRSYFLESCRVPFVQDDVDEPRLHA